MSDEVPSTSRKQRRKVRGCQMNLVELLKSVKPEERLLHLPMLSPTQVEQLRQCLTVTWDGNIMCKFTRGQLVELGLVRRWNGYTIATQDGLAVLDVLGLLKDPRGE